MNLDIAKIENMELHCGDESLMEINQIDNVETVPYETNKKYDFHDLGGDITIEFSTDNSNVDMMDLLGIDLSRMPDKYDIQYLMPVQKRKHKKKRINKKWAKRYGSHYVTVTTKGFCLKTYTDGKFELVKENTRREFDSLNGK